MLCCISHIRGCSVPFPTLQFRQPNLHTLIILSEEEVVILDGWANNGPRIFVLSLLDLLELDPESGIFAWKEMSWIRVVIEREDDYASKLDQTSRYSERMNANAYRRRGSAETTSRPTHEETRSP